MHARAQKKQTTALLLVNGSGGQRAPPAPPTRIAVVTAARADANDAAALLDSLERTASAELAQPSAWQLGLFIGCRPTVARCHAAPTSAAGVDVVVVVERGAAPDASAADPAAGDATAGALPGDAEALLVARAVSAAAAQGYDYFLVLSADDALGSAGWVPALVTVLREAQPLANFGVALARAGGASPRIVTAPCFHRTHLDVFGAMLPAPLLRVMPGATHARGAARVLPWLAQAYGPCAVHRTNVVLLRGGSVAPAALDSALEDALAAAAAAGRVRASAWIAAMRGGELLVCEEG